MPRIFFWHFRKIKKKRSVALHIRINLHYDYHLPLFFSLFKVEQLLRAESTTKNRSACIIFFFDRVKSDSERKIFDHELLPIKYGRQFFLTRKIVFIDNGLPK